MNSYDILNMVGQILAGLLIVVPFIIKDRYREGKWIFQKNVKKINIKEITINIYLKLILGWLGTFSSIFAFIVKETLIGYILFCLTLYFLTNFMTKIIKRKI